ncbi:MAG: PEP/pyruvate-binding domain-containing protein [Microlunatus sp.]
MMNNSVAVDLADIGPDELATVGGKALNLGRMLAAGLPVPTGFCVTTTAYRRVVGDLLDGVIADLRDEPHGDDSAERARIAEQARELILDAPVPDDLAAAITSRYASLGDDVPVAVRSSATAEDLAGASFAGQQDTYLNVVGAGAVLDATRRCWASLWTERAISYRTTQGIDHAEVTLAVVIQQLVDAEVAGVMFTANPVTGNRRQLVVDASPGLGESVVSGAVNPDRFVLDAATGAVVDRRLGDKRTAVRPAAGGGTRTEDLTASDIPCLDRTQLDALTDLARQVAGVYNEPQDTEWVIDADGTAWLTQARPITTLYPLAPARDHQPRAYLCGSLAQGLTRPITPMGQAAFRVMGSHIAGLAGFRPRDPLAGPSGLAIVGERMFADITPLLRHRRARSVLVKVAGVMEARTKAVLELLESDPRFTPLPTKPSGSAAPAMLRLMIKTRAPVRLVIGLASPRAAHRAADRIDASIRRRWRTVENLTPEQRLDALETRLANDTFVIMPTVFPYAAAGLLSMAIAQRLAPDDLDPTLFADVRRGLPHNVTTEMDLELWQLATRIGRDDKSRTIVLGTEPKELAAAYGRNELPGVVQTGLAGFLERYGHRAVAEIDLGMPRWSDEPEHLLGVLANYLRLDDPELAPDRQFARGAAVAEAAISTIIAATRHDGRLGIVRARLMAFALHRSRALIGLRERPKSIWVYALASARREFLILGRATVAAGSINDAEDTFFLDLRQLRAAIGGVDQRAVVRERRATYEFELRRRHIPRVLLSDGTEPETLIGVEAPDGALVGSAASVGTVTGPARVIMDPAGAHLEPGEILVAPSTDPGWTPLFLTAGGLVMEMGGSMSHGAVVAREYGIPAVVGVPDATTAITTGQQITVDGAAGIVVLT